ncbi:MAG TPA: hypothetical protein VIK33_09625 [Anaerolineae bacterium]
MPSDCTDGVALTLGVVLLPVASVPALTVGEASTPLHSEPPIVQ